MGFLGVRINRDLEEKIRATGRPKSEVVRAALRAYFEGDRSPDQEVLIREIERLLDEKLSGREVLNSVKQPPLNTVKQKHKALNTVKQEPPGQAYQELVKKAAKRILDYFDSDQEPTAQQIADDLGVESRPLGKIMSASGLQARNVRRDGIRVRRYTFDQRENIETFLDRG